jgi:hypothetical protein
MLLRTGGSKFFPCIFLAPKGLPTGFLKKGPPFFLGKKMLLKNGLLMEAIAVRIKP